MPVFKRNLRGLALVGALAGVAALTGARAAAACVAGPALPVTIPETSAAMPTKFVNMIKHARNGLAPGYLTLGIHFDAGIDVPPDPRRAAGFYQEAIRRGDDFFAPLLLARLHARGRGVAFDPALVEHYARVATAGDPGEGLRETLLSRFDVYFGAGWVPEQPFARARDWWKSRDDLSAVELWRQGQSYLHGYGVPVCAEMGEEFLRKSRKNHEPVFEYMYVEHLLRTKHKDVSYEQIDDNLSRIDNDLLLRGLYRAAEEGLPAAQHRLGQIFLQGTYTKRHALAAYYWLWQAREAGVEIDADLWELWNEITPDYRALLGRFLLHDWQPMQWLHPILNRERWP